MRILRNSTSSPLAPGIPLAFAFALFGAIPANAGLITNGDFEANGGYIHAGTGLPPFGLPGLPVPTGWVTLNAAHAAAIIGVNFCCGNPPFNLPSHAAALYGGGGISQSFATVMDGNYVLSFDGSGLAFHGIPHLPLMTVTLFDGAVSLASTSYLETANFADPPVAHSLAFKAASGTTRVEFSFIFSDPIYDGRYFALLDNVVVSDATSATPEPASWMLLLLGTGLLAAAAFLPPLPRARASWIEPAPACRPPESRNPYCSSSAPPSVE